MATIQQAFERVAAIQGSHQILDTQFVLLYTVLDTLSTLRSAAVDTMFEPSSADKVLAGLRATIPTAAQRLLLTAPQAAVDALHAVHEGFFLPLQLSPDLATKRYLKLRRNATHGFESNKDSVAAMNAELLAKHSGSLGAALPHLGYLYLLDLLTHPERITLARKRAPLAPSQLAPSDNN